MNLIFKLLFPLVLFFIYKVIYLVKISSKVKVNSLLILLIIFNNCTFVNYIRNLK